MSDLVLAFRALRKTPAFTTAAVLTLSVGVGASVALFSIFDRLVLHPVDVPAPSTLVALWASNPQLSTAAPAVSWPRYRLISEHATVFSSVGVSAFDSFSLTGAGDPAQLAGQRVSATFFPTLGVMPAIGRNFTPEEDVPNGPAVCIISHEFWQTRLAGRASIVNDVITLNGQPWQVVGIMPPHLSAPFGQVQVFAPRVFEVSTLSRPQIDAGASFSQPIARLKAGVSLAQAAQELAALSDRYHAQFPSLLDANNQTAPQMFAASLVGNLVPTFYTLIGAVSSVLLIACANVASLFMGRLSARDKEIAVRQALGAGRVAIVRQFLFESLVLSVAAGLAGAAMAFWGLSAVGSLMASQLPPNTVLTLNWRAYGLIGGLICLCALLVGLMPAVRASKPQLAGALREASRGSTGAGGRFRTLLMIGEVALSVVLLVGSSLLLVSLDNLLQATPGFDASGAATAFVNANALKYKTPVQQAEFFERVFEQLRRDPAVTDAAAAIGLPFSGFTPRSPYVVAGSPILPFAQRPLAGLSIVSEDYFRLMRIGIVEGRAFNAGDRDGAPGVCIINESLANKLFPGQSALGRVMLRGPNADVRNEIVGVIRNVKTNGLTAPAPDEIYFPMRQFGRLGMNILARTDGDPSILEPILRRAVAAVDRDQPISFFTTLEQSIATSVGVQRIVASLTTVFAGLSLVLAAVGLYSVLAYVVSQRRSEIGIRLALGSRRAQVVGLMMRSGLRPVAVGLGVGLGAAAGVGQLIRSLLFDIKPGNPLVYAAVTAVFVLTAALACLVPSLRASRVDPAIALRNS